MVEEGSGRGAEIRRPPTFFLCRSGGGDGEDDGGRRGYEDGCGVGVVRTAVVSGL